MDSYYKVDAISYSMLRNLSVGPAYFKFQQEKESEDKEHFIIGGAVDCLLTEPDKFWEKYALEFSEICKEVPTPQLRDYGGFLYAGLSEEEAFEKTNFKREKLESVKDRFEKEAKDWFEWIKKKGEYDKSIVDKQLISNSQYSLITKIVESLKTNRFTRKYFEGTIGTKVDKHLQLEIYWEYKGQKCKSKLDLVVVDHDNREIHPIDIKTTGNSVFSFDSSALKWRYDLQASFYSSALYWLINKSNNEYWNNLKDYTIKPFKFIVESSKYPGMPLIYECSEKFLNMGIEGFMHEGQYYKGFIQLINEYLWYKENDEWTYPKNIIENNGIISLTID